MTGDEDARILVNRTQHDHAPCARNAKSVLWSVDRLAPHPRAARNLAAILPCPVSGRQTRSARTFCVVRNGRLRSRTGPRIADPSLTGSGGGSARSRTSSPSHPTRRPRFACSPAGPGPEFGRGANRRSGSTGCRASSSSGRSSSTRIPEFPRAGEQLVRAGSGEGIAVHRPVLGPDLGGHAGLPVGRFSHERIAREEQL